MKSKQHDNPLMRVKRITRYIKAQLSDCMHQAEMQARANLADRVYCIGAGSTRLQINLCRKLARLAHLDSTIPFLHAHNALVARDAGHPWLEVRYPFAVMIRWMEQHTVWGIERTIRVLRIRLMRGIGKYYEREDTR